MIFRGSLPKKLVRARTIEGEEVEVRLYKRPPNRWSVPHQVCVACLRERIHKNDPHHDSKICKGCTARGAKPLVASISASGSETRASNRTVFVK